MFDIAIIGTGPAGLEAAITAKVRNKEIILFGTKELSHKMSVVEHPIQNYLGLPEATGKDMMEAFQKHLDVFGIEIHEQKVTTVYKMPESFSLQLSNGEMVEAKSIILACGVAVGNPYPGEAEFLGRGVSYCATCDGMLYKGKTVACISTNPKEEEEVKFLSEIVEKVYYFPLYKEEVHLPENVEVIYEKPTAIQGGMKVETLETDKNQYEVSCVFILRESQFPSQLVPGVEVENNHVKVDSQMRTNLEGVFAAGDITGQPYQYIKAAGQGNVAALSAVSYLAKKDNK